MHARNPHSPFQRQHMMDCYLSAQQDTGTMQAVIGQA
uniref:POU class 6 homeobox 2 n=1 Tax=Homo sapiens TaxID=9606 RepID=A0A669KBB9_HUMAN